MAPRDMRTPSQVAQDAEASMRNRSIIDDAGNDLGADPRQSFIDDATGEDADPAIQQQDRRSAPAEDEPEVVDRRSPGDIRRAEIAKRFKRNKDGEGDVPYNGDPNDPEMQYGKVARPPDAEPDPGESAVGSRVNDPPVEQQPKLTKIVVRGKDVYLTDAQILERASKVEAADSYLDEGRAMLEEARKIRNQARSGLDPHHPEGQTGADDGLDPDADDSSQHPDELVEAIEQLQFGDPKEAAGKIRKAIETEADKSADKRQMTRLLDNDLAKAQADLQGFYTDNPDLATDEIANVVLLKTVYDIYREDITKLGIAADQLPKTEAELANWYRFYRVEGKPVKSARQVFDEAKRRYDKWRGVGPARTEAQQPVRVKPRVEVSVDRDGRRMNIPNQPTRAVAPRPDAVRQAPTRKSRSEIIADMRRSRGRPG